MQQQRHDLRQGVEQPDLRDAGAQVFQIETFQRAIHPTAQVGQDHRDEKNDQQRGEKRKWVGSFLSGFHEASVRFTVIIILEEINGI